METGLVRASVLLRRSLQEEAVTRLRGGESAVTPADGEMLQHSLICPAGRGGNPPCLLFEVFRC